MTLQQIMYFQRVARSGSFTKAARACFVSQTAISRQISALEEELHVTLLERDTAHVKLTLAGEYFFQQVNELTARLEEVVTRTQTIAQEQQTHLTLGIPTILEQHAISQLLRQYHSLHPEVQLSTVADSRQQLVSQLVDRKIDPAGRPWILTCPIWRGWTASSCSRCTLPGCCRPATPLPERRRSLRSSCRAKR